VESLERLFDDRAISGEGSDHSTDVFAEVLDALNAVLQRLATARAYLVAHVAVDSRDDVAQARLSELHRAEVVVAKLETRFTAWLGAVDVDDLIERSPAARGHSFVVRRAGEAARHLMSRPEE
jgi:oligoendopeptidase F